jgi:hypothetical protein
MLPKEPIAPDSPTTISVDTTIASNKEADVRRNLTDNPNLTDDFNGIGTDTDPADPADPTDPAPDTSSVTDEASRESESHLNRTNDWTSPLLDKELDAAVQRALQVQDGDDDDDDDSQSQPSYSHYQREADAMDDDDDDDESVVSAQSVSSIKSAVQLRLEGRKKTSASMEALEAKLDAANQRKLFLLQSISGKRQAQLEKVSSARSLCEDLKDAELTAMKKSLDRKLAGAVERKEYFMHSKTSQLRSKNNKTLSLRSIMEQQMEEETKAMRAKLDLKRAQASTKKESVRLEFSEKMQAKMDKISETKKSAQEGLKDMGQKLADKMAAANTRKELLDAESKDKIEDNSHKRERVISETKKSAQEGLKEMGQKLADKMAAASTRKELLDAESKGKIESNSKRQERATLLMNSKDANISSKKLELDSKLSSAVERSKALIDAKSDKAAAYLARAYEHGQELLKKEKIETMSLNGDDMIMNLSSIGEHKEYDPKDEAVDTQALQWLDDENSVASFSTIGSKSRAQLRLERYEKSILTQAALNAKLEAAVSRRELAISNTQEKAGFQAKMDKVSNTMQSAELKVKEMSEKFADKMKAASERKAKIMEESVRGNAVSTNIKLEKAKDRQIEKDAKVSAMQQKLENKLLAALERKEAMVNTKRAKAAGDVSVSSERGQNAMKKKELMMEKLRTKSARKLDSAKSRKKKLRELETQKKEVMMLRREMARSMTTDDELRLLQKKLDGKIVSAHARNQNFIAAKAAKAAEYTSSVSDRGQEAMKLRESSELETKSKAEDKLETAMKRRASLAEKDNEKMEIRNARRQQAMEVAKQRKSERSMIESWQGSVALPSVNEETDDLLDNQSKGSVLDDDDGYDEKRLVAKRQLVEEIRIANEAKYEELARITKEMKAMKKPDPVQRDASAFSLASFGTIDTNDLLSFDEGDMSISGLSTVREEEQLTDRRKAQAALALAELDIKLSEIQLMQAILLAEEASLSGKSEFKTEDKSVADLNRKKVTQDMFLSQDDKADRKEMLKNRAKDFFAHTVKQAKVAQGKASITISQLKRNMEKNEIKRKGVRPSTAPSGISR